MSGTLARLCLLLLCACDARACGAPPVVHSAGLAPGVLPDSPETARCSVVLVTLDTARADHFGVYGDASAHTPVFDALAAQGVRYTRATTPTPLTVPAHTTIFTGLNPAVHGTEVNAPPPPPLEGRQRPELLAEAFGAAGYRRAAFVASIVLAPRMRLDTGFEVYDAPGLGVHELTAQDRVTHALAWLDTIDREPFFLWVHFMEAHAPHVAPPGSAPGVDAYDAELTATDTALGALLVGLEARGLGERLVVVVAGDHGEGLDDHGEREHGVFLYDETVRVPLVIRSSNGFAGGRVVDAPVTLADLSPTLRGLCALPAVETDGASLRAPPERRDLLGQSVYPERALGWAPLFAIRRDSLVYIEAPRPELYDLAADPGERENLAAARPETARTLASALASGRAELATERRTGVQVPAHREERARLAALGYATQMAAPVEGRADPKDMITEYEARRAAQGIVGTPAAASPSP